jgi:L-lactate dehydrogenase complex protein LldG
MPVIAFNPIEKYCQETAYGCFMAGPSATADIEATLVHGAQGARSLDVFLLPRA